MSRTLAGAERQDDVSHRAERRQVGGRAREVDDRLLFVQRTLLAGKIEAGEYDDVADPIRYALARSLLAWKCHSTVGADPWLDRIEDVRDPHRLPGLDDRDVDASESGAFMTDDGRVAFSSTDALVPRDTNRTIDVYEFTGNRPQLVSAGTGDRVKAGGRLFYPGLNTGFEGFSADGTDLYFSTFDSLVPQDRNGSFVKFYDARTNGGFPATPPPLPCSAADECHGDSSAPPSHPSVGTGGDLGSGGNLQPVKKKRRGKHRRKHRKSTHVKRQGRRHHG